MQQIEATTSARFTAKNIEDWRGDGAVLLPSFFSTEEMKPIAEDFERLYSYLRPTSTAAVTLYAGDKADVPHMDRLQSQARGADSLPFNASPALNLLGLHPALIEFAKAALGVQDVRMYECLTWPKFTGQTDFDQPFHMDYHGHTLTVPGDTPQERSVTFSIYASDVTDAHGATHYVPRPAGDTICGDLRPDIPDHDQQTALRKIERSGAGPIGSVLAYSADVYHRGTNLTAENGHRYTLFVAYKAAHNDAVAFTAWPSVNYVERNNNPWEHIFRHATPEQLACLDVPRPGDPFWNERTLARAHNRWPMWDLTPWYRAIAKQHQ